MSDALSKLSKQQVERWNLNHCDKPSSYFTSILIETFGMDIQDVALVLVALDEVCIHCFDGPKGCRCWDDS